MGSIVFKSRISHAQSAKNLSVVIIALNEERNLTKLLAEIPLEAEIILVDSQSVDKTVMIAENHGAKVYQRPFDNYSAQKNYAMSLATRPWTLSLDADEIPNRKLWSAILAAIQAEKPAKIYALSRRLVFLGKKMRYGRTCDMVKRLFPSGAVEYRNEIHESTHYNSELRVERLDGVLWHESYRTIEEYFAKFNRYTSMMAKERYNKGRRPPHGGVLALRLGVDFLARYVAKLGFLDGWQGFLWAMFGSVYGFMKYAKLKEMHQIIRQQTSTQQFEISEL